ncbi:hypothetical protein ONS96_010484 [Cadophora gregata f. sp. sojae]|nr:hypothetical protein ONS96_010484 [Cadophora gregata f. sp. sojae]
MTMGDNGLQQSRWATSGGSFGYLNQRPEDWNCRSCGFSNFQWRTSCFRCSTKLDNTSAPTQKNEIFQHTTLPSLQVLSSQIEVEVIRNEVVPATAHAGSLSVPTGLAVSRWAPRNATKWQSNPNEKVWTRTVQKPIQTPSRSQTPPPKPSDLGLPYQVQHYILVMIQRMLEESCFEFATRWIPEALHVKGWDCAEAVELSVWKAFLPTILPSNSIRPMSNYTLEAALGDAVRIRNSAVHRHLCDNDEIRKMSLQAQDLMAMFSDSSRQDKFHRLWLELKEWDTTSISDAHGARVRLEIALREISERPVDGMDWTPNAMSLEQVTSDLVGQDRSGYTDEMELD